MGRTCDRGCKSSLSFEGRLDATLCTLMAHLPVTSQGGTSLSIKARPPPWAWDATCGHKSKDITPLITRRREVWKAIFLERTREGHHQSDEHWNCFEGQIGETSERRGGVHNYGLFPSTQIPSWTEMKWTGCQTSRLQHCHWSPSIIHTSCELMHSLES